jgi:hypothetical protein
MNKFYFQLNGDIIIDAINYPHGDYVEVELEEDQLPAGINSGCYRLIDGEYILDEELEALIE